LALSAFVLSIQLAQAQQPEALTPWQGPVLQLPAKTSPLHESQAADAGQGSGPTARLYRALRSVGLDENKVFHVREAELDRGELHLFLTDGTIAFTHDVVAA